jgi:hypothetical protein
MKSHQKPSPEIGIFFSPVRGMRIRHLFDRLVHMSAIIWIEIERHRQALLCWNHNQREGEER